MSVTDEWVDTGAGRTHVLTAGDPVAPPVVVLQGSNITNPVTLAWFGSLADEYRLVAPDTPGQPGKSTTATPDEYGAWIVDLLDGLGLDRLAAVGVSHGGGVLLEAAVRAPDRIGAAVLVVPAGFGTPLSLTPARIVGPSLIYRLFPSQTLLTRALAPMFTQSVRAVEPVVVDTVARALRTAELAVEFPGPTDPAALAGFGAPTLAITGERDPFFPGERHFLSPAGQARAADRIRGFLSEHVGHSG